MDLGCIDCPEGYRRLQKNYYTRDDGTGDFYKCSDHREETVEEYCVPDKYARCDIKDYRSDPSDFVWGCSDPRRPIMWTAEAE